MNFLMASHSIGRVNGIDIRISYSLYLLIAFFALPALGQGQYGYALGVVCLPVFVLLHELGHSFTAQWLGVTIRRITLHILGGAAEFTGGLPGPKAEILVSVAGPAVSVFLSVSAFLLWHLLPVKQGPAGEWLQYCFLINFMLAAFNMIPVFPMDGGRVALALAIMFRGVERGINLMRPISAVGAGLIALYGLYEMTAGQNPYAIMMIFIAIMLYFRGGQEMQARLYAQQYSSGGGNREFYYSDGRDAYSGGNPYASRQKSGNAPWMGVEQARVVDDEELRAASKEGGWFSRWRKERTAQKAESRAAEDAELNRLVDEVLKKVNEQGITSLTPGERALLMRASEKYHQK